MKYNRNIIIFLSFLFFALIMVQISGAVGPIPDTTETYPSWSPDGQKILFISYGPMSQGIFIVKPDGSDLQKISSDGWNPSWSPDGTKIVLTKVFEDDNSSNQSVEISLLDINTRNITRLTYGGAKKSVPKFSADGKKIVFESYDNYVYIINSDGTNLRKVVEFSRYPDFSPDGKKIVYFNAYNMQDSIWVINLDGSEKEKVFIDYSYRISVNYRWTPDSKYLLLNNYSNTITKVNISNPTDIEYIYDPVAHWDPEYSPDGNYITFVSNMDGGRHDLFVARSNGSEVYNIVFDTNLKPPVTPDYFYKKSRPAPSPWPMPESTPDPTATQTPVVTSTATSTASSTPAVPGFSILLALLSIPLLVLAKKSKR